jgi:hypothetical protein
MTMIKNSFQEKALSVQNKINEVSQEIKETKILFLETIKELFEKHSWANTIMWRQYEQLHYEGDDEVFYVFYLGDEFYINGIDKYGEVACDEEDEEISDEKMHENSLKVKEISKELDEIFYSVNKDIFKKLFGTNTQITIHRNGKIAKESYFNEDY